MTYILMEFDLAGAEWIVTAFVANEPRMIDVIRQGKDPHLNTGALISGASEAEVAEESKAVGLTTDPTAVAKARESFRSSHREGLFLPRSMSIRQAAKKANHGLNYGEGYRTFALKNEMDERDAKNIQDRYLNRAYPGIPEWHEEIAKRLNKDRTLYSCEIGPPMPLHRKQRFLEAWGSELHRRAYSFVPQSTVGDITNRAMILFYRDRRLAENMDLLAQVHDSILLQTQLASPAKSQWVRVAHKTQIVCEHLSPTLRYEGREFTIPVGLKIGPNWGAMEEVTLTDDIDRLADNLAETWERACGTRTEDASEAASDPGLSGLRRDANTTDTRDPVPVATREGA